MASYLDKAVVNTAITDNTKLDLSHQSISTMDMMQLNIGYIHEMVPGEKISVNAENFARLNPMPVPTFGRARWNQRCYFVPFRTIYPGWNDFITDTVHIFADNNKTSDIQSQVPTVSNRELVDAFANYVGTTDDIDDIVNMIVPAIPMSDSYDIELGASRYNFTILGRQCIKMLEQLGYKIYWDKDYNYTFSAMPLLALAKVYIDYYFPTQYYNINEYDRLASLLKFDMTSGTGIVLNYSDVQKILSLTAYVCFDSDYFTSAWDTPNQPNIGAHSDFKLQNIDSVSTLLGTSAFRTSPFYADGQGYVTNNSGSAVSDNLIGGANAPFISSMAPFTNPSGTAVARPTPISEFLLHSLHALTDYMKRHQMAGTAAFDRYLARFGKALPAEKLNRCLYLGGHSQDIQIGDIMSTADTEGANLGSYSGKGISYGKSSFDYSTDEFGYLIVLNSIVPETGYFQGIDKQTLRIFKNSFYTPEFDNLGVQAIDAVELYVPQEASSNYSNLPNQVFGFTPRYADYKISHDQLTGNFRLPSINGSRPNTFAQFNAANSWHLMRSFDSTYFAYASEIVHSPDFLYGILNALQFKRLFYDVEPSAPDNFTTITDYKVAAYAPMKALYDTYEFEDKGKKVTLNVNGVVAN